MSMLSQLCSITNEKFSISTEELELRAEIGFNPPTISPTERLRLLLSFLPGRSLAKRSCSKSGVEIFSGYPESAKFPVQSPDVWVERDWQSEQLALTFSPDVSFFVQLHELWNAVPRPSLFAIEATGSIVVDGSVGVKDSLYIFNSQQVERCAYSAFLLRCSLVADSLFCIDCRLCYECIGCSDCEALYWSENSSNCSDCVFVSGCIDCSNCVCCTGLSGARDCLFNQHVGPDAIARFLAEHNLFSETTDRRAIDELREQAAMARRGQPVPERWSDDSSSGNGNYLLRASAENGYFISDSNAVFHGLNLHRSRSVIDSMGLGTELIESFQAVSCSGSRLLSSISCYRGSDVWYSSHCVDCSNLIGCVGLKGKEFCILNQQYDADQFAEIRDWLANNLDQRGIWGAFPTSAFAGIPYNSSLAHEFMALTPIQAELLQFEWEPALESALKAPAGAVEPPHRLDEIELSSSQGAVLICEMTGRPYSFYAAELSLYRELKVPPPGRCFEQRHAERIKRTAVGRLHSARCSTTGQTIRTPNQSSAKSPVLERKAWKSSLITPTAE
jgi:hypothetical protein